MADFEQTALLIFQHPTAIRKSIASYPSLVGEIWRFRALFESFFFFYQLVVLSLSVILYLFHLRCVC